MRLYRRPESKCWYVDLTHPVTKQRIRRRLDTELKREATVRAAELSVQMQREAEVDRDGKRAITLEQAFMLYADKLQSDKKASASNALSRATKLVGKNPRTPDTFFLPPSKWLHDLSSVDLEDLIKARQREGLAPQSIAHELNLIRSASRYVAGMKYRAPEMLSESSKVNPWRLPKIPQKTRYLSLEEWDRVYTALSPDRRGDVSSYHYVLMRDSQELMVALTLTGGRFSEVAKLTWSQVDTSTFKAIRVWGNKTQKERLVPVPEKLSNILRERYARRDPEQNVIFPGRTGKARSGSSKAILRALSACGLNAPEIVARHGKATVHSLRHTFASWLVQGGANIFEVQDALGHASVHMTRRYTHLSRQKTADRLAGLLDQVGQSSP